MHLNFKAFISDVSVEVERKMTRNRTHDRKRNHSVVELALSTCMLVPTDVPQTYSQRTLVVGKFLFSMFE